MKVNSVKNSIFQNAGQVANLSEERTATGYSSTHLQSAPNNPSFRGSGSDFSKKMWLLFRKLSNYMKEPSEMTNAEIAFIGTGAIAPFAIMCSPRKKDVITEEDKKVDREKKKFQALRQPVSALLAFGFQVPTTIGIGKGFDYLAYKKQAKFFNDETIGALIPDKKYLKKQAIAVLKGKANPALQTEWTEELAKAHENNAQYIQELKNQIKTDYEEVGINISDEKLDKLAGKEKTRRKFIAEKMANSKHEKLFEAKIKELSGKSFDIKDIDLVTENYQDLAKVRHKEEFAKLKQNAKLNLFDKFIASIGISNKKLSNLSNAEKALAKERGLELMKQDKPDVFTDPVKKLRNFVENKNVRSQKLYSNKIFWLTLVTNLFMVGISCIALNWLHPKFADFVDKIKERKAASKAGNEKKVEVAA